MKFFLTKLALIPVLLTLSITLNANWSIINSYAIIDQGSGLEYYYGINDGVNAPISGTYFGILQPGSTFLLKGAEIRSNKNNTGGNSDVCGGTMYYRVYRLGDTPGSFISVDLNYDVDSNFGDQPDGLGGINQQWEEFGLSTDLLNGLNPGRYALEVYFEAEGSQNGGCASIISNNNGGNNFIAFFDYDMTDSFTDGNFSANPVWSGDTGSWTIVANSDVSTGATGSNTLRLNHNSGGGTRYISTPYSNWQDEQTWSFFFGRRSQNLTDNDNVEIWLYANNSNLESGTVDGYRLIIGDDSGGDEIRLQSVTNLSGTTILTSAAITNNRQDFGLGIKVTRNNAGTWTLYTSAFPASSGSGALASEYPEDIATVDRGSVTNNTYDVTGTGYFGFVVEHSGGSSARTAQEFDQIRISTSALIPGCTDDAALNYNPSAQLDNGSCVFPNIVITEIHYNPNDGAGFPDDPYEFLEIYNNGFSIVDLSGWSFSGITFTFPANTFIAPGEFIVIAIENNTYSGNGYQVFEFGGGLSNSGEQIELLTPDGNIVDEVDYDDSGPWPSAADGSGPSAQLNNPNNDNDNGSNWTANVNNGTPGSGPGTINGCTDPSATNFNGFATNDNGSCSYGAVNVIITEIHYNPCAAQGSDTNYEFIELYNSGGSSVNITGWAIPLFGFTFPSGSSIAVGEYVIVTSLTSSYSGNGYQVFGSASGSLDNAGENIVLINATGAAIDAVSYRNTSPWALNADGQCSSLELISTGSNNFLAANWQSSYVEFGTPGAVNSTYFECVDCADPGAVSTIDLNQTFESGSLDWTESVSGDWTVSNSSPINGTYSLKHNLSAVSGASEVSHDMDCLIYNELCTSWRFQIATSSWDPTAGDKFLIHLAASENSLNSGTVDGYAVGVNYSGTNDRLSLYRITDGAVAAVLMESSKDLNGNDVLGVEIIKDASGNWMLKIDNNGGFDNLLAVSNSAVADLTYTEGRYFGVRYEFATSANAGGLRIDDVSISQCGIETIYYSVSSGNTGDAIWSTNDLAVVGSAISFSRFKRLVVQTGHTVTTNGRVIADDMSTETGGTLVGNASPFDIILYGNFIVDGAFDPGASLVKLNGSSPQIIASANPLFFNKLSMDNPTTMTLGSATSIRNVLYPNKGTLLTNGNLTLLDNATYTGYVAPYAASANISGDVVHQTYLQLSTNTGWTTVGPATDGLSIQDWNDDMITTGFPGSDYPLSLFTNVQRYDESIPGARSIGYVFPASNLELLNNNVAYYIYEFANAITLDAVGSVRKGSITLPLEFTNTGGGPNDGWNMVYNIYPAPVDLEALVANSDPAIGSGPETATTFYMWNQSLNSYQVYQAVTMTGTAPRFVAPSQAFFVNVAASHLDFQFDEWIKDVDQTGLNILREEPAFPKITLGLSSGVAYDEAYLIFRQGAQAGFEPMDAIKLYSFDENAANFAFVNTDGEDLVIDARSLEELQQGLSIPIFLNAIAGGNIELSLEGLENMPDNLCMSIEDLLTGEFYTLQEGESFSFNADEQTSSAAICTTSRSGGSCSEVGSGLL
jgi:hypothetical protein